ncbi:hypothetical protein Taro_003114 [Colocasia esculenta]|uniref:Nucleotide-diphospho-sugar transferase domain-containing protein n=1 Tax=Colocasia esculenta TaxID=4460 RepID=A0A843TIZ6_COLES|nr:hypothetical protein [Colocasia esculenta]
MGVGWWQDRAGWYGKPLFLAVYAAVAAGIVLSAFFIFTSFYSSGFYSGALTWSSSSPPVSDLDSFSPRIPVESSSSRNTALDSGTKLGRNFSVSQSHSSNIWTRDIWDVPTAGSKTPPLDSFRLTKEVAKYRVKDNVLIVTFGNYAFMDFILNWVKHLTDINVTNLLVGAMDTKLLEALYWKGVPVYDMGSNMRTIDVGWGSLEFHKMGREKVFLLNALLPFGYELLVCDTDMVWLKNPLPYIARFPEADILTSSDQLIPTVTDDSLETWDLVSGAFNIGIFHWRPTDPAKRLAKAWKDLLLSDEKIWDQNGFNELVRKVYGPPVKKEPDLVYTFDGTLKLGILPASMFCSGHTYFVQAQHQQLRLQPYAVHTTFQYAGTEGKRHRLREGMLFYDPPAYYDPPGGFLSFKPHLPKSLLLDGAHTVENHFSLVNFQMKQIRTALAIASLSNRILVMPPLWCRLDRLWYGHPGILPGTMSKQPFLCPLDHVFEVHVMLSELSEEEFGPKIDFREYSFFDNPLLPKKVKESWLEVQPCEEGSENCNMGGQPKPGVLTLPKHSSEEMVLTILPHKIHVDLSNMLMRLLSSHKDVKVLEFSSMEDVFQGFTSKGREQKFRNRVKRYVGIWCCLENLEIGHIYYDMYWGEKPGWKPKPPNSREDDHPPL